jgi:hypothetical protein
MEKAMGDTIGWCDVVHEVIINLLLVTQEIWTLTDCPHSLFDLTIRSALC